MEIGSIGRGNVSTVCNGKNNKVPDLLSHLHLAGKIQQELEKYPEKVWEEYAVEDELFKINVH